MDGIGAAHDDPDGAALPPPRRDRWRPLRIAGLVLLAMALLVAALAAALDTSAGRRLVARQISAMTFANGLRLTVGRIDGSLCGAMTLHDVALRDGRGAFLSAPRIAVDWRPLAYLRSHVDIRSASAARVVLHRVPELKASRPDAPLLPDLDIDVGTLRIDQFIAEPAVSGERRVLAIRGSAHLADGRARLRANADTISGAGRAGGDRLALTLDARPAKRQLDLALTLRAPAEGVVAALAGLDRSLDVTVGGRGDWTKWDGNMSARLGGQDLTRLVLTARDGTFGLTGPAWLDRLPTARGIPVLGGQTSVDLSARFSNRRAAISGVVAGENFRLAPGGVIDLSASRFDRFRLALDLPREVPLAQNLTGAGVRANLTLDGTFAEPEVAYRLNARRLVVSGTTLADIAASGTAQGKRAQWLVPVTARVGQITGLEAVAGGTLTNISVTGDLAAQWPRILSDNLRIRSDRIDARLLLAADIAAARYTGAVDGRIDQYRLAGVGLFRIDTRMDLQRATSGFALQGTVRARSTSLSSDALKSYLGGNLAASAEVRYGTDGIGRMTNLRLTAPNLRVTSGQGAWFPDGRIALQAAGTSPRYGPLGLHLAGTMDRPEARVTAPRPDLGIGLANLDARIITVAGGYRLDASGDTDYGPLRADVTLGLGTSTVLQINRANLSGVDFTGSLAQTAAGPFAGTLAASGNGVSGLLRMTPEGRYQAADFDLRARDAVFAGPARLTVGSAAITGHLVMLEQPQVTADVQLAATRFGAFDLTAGRVKADYQRGRGNVAGLIEGISGVPFRLGLNADLTPRLWRVAVQGRVRGQTIRTASPARIVPGPGRYELLPASLEIGGGTARIAGSYGPGLTLQSRIEGIDLAIVNAFFPGYGIGGSASGTIDFAQDGTGATPHAEARLMLTNFTRTSATTISQPVAVNFIGKLAPTGGEARAVIRRQSAVIGRLIATLGPLAGTGGDWSSRLRAAPLGGGIRYEGNADTLFSLVGQAGQSITGPVSLAADFSCRVADPCLNGIVRGRGLTYENQAYGTRLSDVEFSGRFSGNTLDLNTLTARAGTGTISASGRIGLSAEEGYPLDLTAKLTQARLARSEALSASATGTLRLTRQAGQSPLLSGDLHLPETRYQIVREGAASVPSLTGVRFKPDRAPRRITGDEVAAPAGSAFPALRLDLRLQAPDKLFVTGMGLDSEWGASFALSGTTDAPRMTGQVNLVRGTLDFAGRAFRLQEGRITFAGGPINDPTVAITATEDIDDLAISVNVTGRATDPRVDFASAPALPDDEILSRVLFGSSIANLSAIQAVQLASSLNALRARSGGLNPLGRLRSATGLSRLRILAPDEASGRGTALAAGQYLTDRIYIELVTDARGFTATQLEVSLTRWLSLLSQAGGSGANSVNLRIRKDY
ncbi:MAG TPA: translocation/assembly module TamB domain-containing protein [Novosphingobium sp.]|nr:translocation/assembly module TamB domain-containing protein [Novosphingobium sp.]